MAIARTRTRDPKAWEKIAAWFAFFAVLKDAPVGLRALCPPPLREFARRVVLVHLGSWRSSEFLWSALFTAGTAFFLAWVLWGSKPGDESVNEDVDEERRKTIERVWRRHQLIRVVRSFGLVLVREKLLDLFGVATYHTFPRSEFTTVEPAPDRFDYIDRIKFTDGIGREYQYPRGPGLVFVREATAKVREYGLPERRKLTPRERCVLLIGSNFYGFWLLHRPWAWVGAALRGRKTEDHRADTGVNGGSASAH